MCHGCTRREFHLEEVLHTLKGRGWIIPNCDIEKIKDVFQIHEDKRKLFFNQEKKCITNDISCLMPIDIFSKHTGLQLKDIYVSCHIM